MADVGYQPDSNLQNLRTQFLQSRRNDANQASNQALQQGEDTINRKFASMGASGSGAQIAAMQTNRNAAADIQRKGLSDVGSQEMQMAESDAGRGFQDAMSNKDIAFKQKLSDVDQGNKLKEMDMAQQQFDLDKETTEFNKQLAQAQLAQNNQAPPGLLGQGGILGTGIGTKKGFLGTGIGKSGLGEAGMIAGGIVGGPLGAAAGGFVGDTLSGGGK